MQPPQLESKNDFENAPHVAEVESISNTDNSQRDTDSLTSVNSTKSAMTSFLIGLKTCCQPTVLILIAQYACSFGLELSVDNIIAALFHSKFNLSLTDSSYVGSVFGLLNLFSRLSGGLFGDYLYKKFRLPGRILAQLLIFTCEGCFLIGFSYSLGRMDSSIIMMVFFSLFVQAAAGSTFSLAPFVDPANAGTVIGIVGAGGKCQLYSCNKMSMS
jgi:NNP family nitrate/nitrite transporter-like MFS transporter